MKRASFALLLMCVIGATGCSRKLVVGVVLPETGDAAVYGAAIKSGVKLAFDEALANHTAPAGLEVMYRDTGSDPARAASTAEALYDAGALVIIGGATSPEAKVMIPIADKRNRVLLSPSASAPDLTRMSVFFFRVFPSDELEGVRAADLLTLIRNARTVLIIQEDNAYSRGLLPVFMNEFKSQRGRIVGSVQIQEPGWEQKVRDMLAAHQPQGVYVCGYGDAILEALRVLRVANYGGAICTTSAINTARFLQRAGDLAEGVFLPLSSFDISSKEEPIATFVRRYQQVYNLTPDSYAAHGYDAALATIYALKDLRSPSGNQLQLRFKGLAEKMGVTGPLAFDDFGNIKHYPRSHWIHDGKIEDYDAYLEREKQRIRKQMEDLLLRGGSGS